MTPISFILYYSYQEVFFSMYTSYDTLIVYAAIVWVNLEKLPPHHVFLLRTKTPGPASTFYFFLFF